MNRDHKDQLVQTAEDQFGISAAALLRESGKSLPKTIQNRLHAARMKALLAQKPEKVYVQRAVLASSTGNRSLRSSSIWDSYSWVAPLTVLVFGLIGIAQWQEESRIQDIAELDVALLSDDVPPDAYADNGFINFLKNGPLTVPDEKDANAKSDSPS